jgi:hypothetical protein
LAIRNSVDLSVGIEDLLLIFDSFNETIRKLDDVKKKEQLLGLLSEIRDFIVKMQVISSEYNKDVVENSSYITEGLLKNEKKVYKREREAPNSQYRQGWEPLCCVI